MKNKEKINQAVEKIKQLELTQQKNKEKQIEELMSTLTMSELFEVVEKLEKILTK